MASTTACAPQGTAVDESSSKLALPYIPDDVFFNILTRLPAKSIIRFKPVCKAWLAMLSSRRFVDTHLELSKARPATLIVPDEVCRQWRGWRSTLWVGYYRYNSGSDVAEALHNQQIITSSSELDALPKVRCIYQWAPPLHCDGVVVISTYDQITVCNPATRESLALHKGSLCVAFGRDPCTSRYKLLSAFQEAAVMDGTTSWVLRLEVLTLGTNVWRRIADPPRLNVRATTVHVGGFIYWSASGENEEYSHVLARFSLADETFSEAPFPPCNGGYVNFTKLEGGLCSVVVPYACEAAKVWTCNGTADNKLEWTLRFTVALPQETITRDVWGDLTPPKFTFHGKDDILMSGGRNDLYRYSAETGEMAKVDVAIEDFRCYHPENSSCKEFPGDQVAFRVVGNYVESLVQIRGGYNSSVKQRHCVLIILLVWYYFLLPLLNLHLFHHAK